MSVIYLPGHNVVLSKADILVNTVNCVGVMGAGVALAFKNAFPEIMEPYQRLCRNKTIRPGTCHLLPLRTDGDRVIHWGAFASKDHWKNPSEMAWIEAGLQDLAANARQIGARSIALPPPGCGLGGLNWAEVEPLVLRHLAQFDLELFAEPSR